MIIVKYLVIVEIKCLVTAPKAKRTWWPQQVSKQQIVIFALVFQEWLVWSLLMICSMRRL